MIATMIGGASGGMLMIGASRGMLMVGACRVLLTIGGASRARPKCLLRAGCVP
jgi:hypothetical protein